MAIIGPIVRNDWFFFVTMFALAALMVLFDARAARLQPASRLSSGTPQSGSGPPGASGCGWRSVYTFSFLFIAMVTAEVRLRRRARAGFLPQRKLRSPTERLRSRWRKSLTATCSASQANENGTEVRFWLYQKPDGKIATVFDACQICGGIGFYKSGNGVVCKNCAAPINPQIGGNGGRLQSCTAESDADRGRIIIEEADIAAGSRMFGQQ